MSEKLGCSDAWGFIWLVYARHVTEAHVTEEGHVTEEASDLDCKRIRLQLHKRMVPHDASCKKRMKCLYPCTKYCICTKPKESSILCLVFCALHLPEVVQEYKDQGEGQKLGQWGQILPLFPT